MHTKLSLLKQLEALPIQPTDTIMVHSSMKAIGNVAGGADTVLDALSEYMEKGLLLLPTHTWATIKAETPHFYVENTPVCVGILPELFRKRQNVHRSLHPTHSVGALGNEAEEFIEGDECCNTPLPRHSTWGRLLDRKGKILLVGVDLTKNTYIHSIEEMADVPNRLTEEQQILYVHKANKEVVTVPMHRHYGSISNNYHRVEQLLIEEGVMTFGEFGDAIVSVCDVEKMTDILIPILRENPELFSNITRMDSEK